MWKWLTVKIKSGRLSIFSQGYVFHNHVVVYTQYRHANTVMMVSYLCRLRVNCVGVFDVLTFDNSQTNHLALMPQYQVLFVMYRFWLILNITFQTSFPSLYLWNICMCFLFCFVASRSSVSGQGGAGFGMQLPGWDSEGEPAESHGAGVYQLLFRPQEPHSVRSRRLSAITYHLTIPISICCQLSMLVCLFYKKLSFPAAWSRVIESSWHHHHVSTDAGILNVLI